MFLSPKSIRQSVAVSFMALAASQAVAELPVDTKGHADWLPISGPVEDKVCPNKKKPGDWIAGYDESFAKQDIVLVTTNNCKPRFMKIAPSSGKLLSVFSNNELMVSQSAKVVNAIPAPQNWWQRSDLVPSKPQGEPSISGPAPGKWMCDIKFGNSQALQATPGALVIPDATRAFYVSTRKDPSIQSERINKTTTVDYRPNGKDVCAMEPVIIMPTEQNITSNGGDKWGSIGAIGKTPSPNVEPAAAAATEFAVVSMLALPFFQFTIMKTQEWLKNHPAVVANNVVVITKGGDLIATTVEMSGLSAVEVGVLTHDASTIRGKIELLRDPSKVDPRSAVPPPNNCGQDEHDKLDRDVTSKCVESGVRTCNPTKPPFVLSNDEILRRFNLNKSCAESREKLDEMCFFGGNKTHRQQASDEWKATLNCLEKLGGSGMTP